MFFITNCLTGATNCVTDATDWNQTKPVHDSALGWTVWPSGRSDPKHRNNKTARHTSRRLSSTSACLKQKFLEILNTLGFTEQGRHMVCLILAQQSSPKFPQDPNAKRSQSNTGRGGTRSEGDARPHGGLDALEVCSPEQPFLTNVRLYQRELFVGLLCCHPTYCSLLTSFSVVTLPTRLWLCFRAVTWLLDSWWLLVTSVLARMCPDVLLMLSHVRPHSLFSMDMNDSGDADVRYNGLQCKHYTKPTHTSHFRTSAHVIFVAWLKT